MLAVVVLVVVVVVVIIVVYPTAFQNTALGIEIYEQEQKTHQ